MTNTTKQYLMIGTKVYTAEQQALGDWIIVGPKGAAYYVGAGRPLDPTKRYYANGLSGSRMTYQGNARMFTVAADGHLVVTR